MLGALEEDEESDEGKEEGGGAGRFGTHERMKGMLTVVSEELMDAPFYYRQGSVPSVPLQISICVSVLQFHKLLNTKKNIPFHLNLHFNLQF